MNSMSSKIFLKELKRKNTYSDKRKLKEFFTSKSILKDCLKKSRKQNEMTEEKILSIRNKERTIERAKLRVYKIHYPFP